MASWEGQKFYVARGFFHVSEGMSHGLVRHVLTTVAGISDEAVKQLRSLSAFLVRGVCPPAPAGVPTSMPPEIHFCTFIAEFMAVLEYGMEGAPVMCTHTVRCVREALGESRANFGRTCSFTVWSLHRITRRCETYSYRPLTRTSRMPCASSRSTQQACRGSTPSCHPRRAADLSSSRSPSSNYGHL